MDKQGMAELTRSLLAYMYTNTNHMEMKKDENGEIIWKCRHCQQTQVVQWDQWGGRYLSDMKHKPWCTFVVIENWLAELEKEE